MTKREAALAQARVAGYHQDSRTFTRLIIESRVKREAMNEAWRSGYRAKESGMPCSCPDCR